MKPSIDRGAMGRKKDWNHYGHHLGHYPSTLQVRSAYLTGLYASYSTFNDLVFN